MPYAILEQLYQRGKGTSLTPGKIAAAVVISAFVILTLVFVALASPSAGFSNALCLSCHEVRAQGEALAQTSHKNVPCLTCHQEPGIKGAVASIFSGASNLAYLANPLKGPSVARSSDVDSARCQLCHQRISKTADIIGSDLVVDHRHFKNVKITCIQCHRGAAHGDKLARGGGLTKGVCLECHNGLDASRNCTLCHRQEVRGVRPASQNTSLGLAHGPEWKTAHGLASLKMCTSCHSNNFCKTCHGMRLPHNDEFIFRHGAIASGRMPDDLPSDGEEVVAAPPPPTGGPAPPVSGTAKGKLLFESKCQICHGLDRPRSAPYTGDQWVGLVDRMRAKGAPLTDDEDGLVVAYLKASRGGRDGATAAGISGPSASVRAAPGALTGTTEAAKSCTTCHKRSYCIDCHAGVAMPHRPKWLTFHAKETPANKVAACFRCHVNDECIQCHVSHDNKTLRLPSGPTLGGVQN